MSTPPMWRRYVRFRGADVEADVADELRFHLEMRAAELIEQGMEPAAARAEAERRFGDIESVARGCHGEGQKQDRKRRKREAFGDLRDDLRFALRGLRKSPGFTAVAVLTLAVGVGATTSIFTVVDGVLLRPLPYADSGRLVALVDAAHWKGAFVEFRERAGSFSGIAGYLPAQQVTLSGDGEPIRAEASVVTAEFFDVLGVAPALGRGFRPDEEQPGSGRAVVLSDGFWRDRFGADRGILGEAVDLDGSRHTVIGITPRGFQFPNASTQLFIPAEIDPADRIGLWSTSVGEVVGRLRPGVTVGQAAAEAGMLAPAMAELFPWDMGPEYGTGATVEPLRERLVGELRPTLLILLAAVGFVLLIACGNVANLLLVRASGRQQDIAVRTALGARRGRIVRQLLTESMLLALIGGAAGLLLAVLGVRVLVARLPEAAHVADISLDWRVLGFAILLTLGTGLLFGILPAYRASGFRLQSVLRQGGRGGTAGSGGRLSGALVAAELALATVLVIGAGLLLKSLGELLSVDPGFRAERLVTATVAPPGQRYEGGAAKREFYRALLERLQGLPGTLSAAATDGLPFGPHHGGVFKIEGRPDPATEGGDWPLTEVYAEISDDYLRTMGIPLLAGRAFTDADRSDAPPVVMISESLARMYWPDTDPVGQRVRGPGPGEWWTIVGVVGDVKGNALVEETSRAVYRPLAQADPFGGMSVVLRTRAAPDVAARGLRSAVAAIDPEVPVDDIRTMEQRISGSVAGPRVAAQLLGGFALVALLLGAIGIYGVIAYRVAQRTREIGVRIALGASRREVVQLIIRQGTALSAAGVAVGLLAAFAATRVMASLLYGVSATDPLIFAIVPLVLLATALLASWLPARRAARVDPMVALRAE